MTLPVLSALIFLPALAALLLRVLPIRLARGVTALAILGAGVLSLIVVAGYDPAGPRFQWLERADWIAGLKVQYLLAVDGLSVFFLPATVLVGGGVLVADWSLIGSAGRGRCTALLLLLSATLGIFCALDTVLFFVFWELAVVPLYFLLGMWGVNDSRGPAAFRYLLFMLAGGVPLLLGFIVLGAAHPAHPFDAMALAAEVTPAATQRLVFGLLLLGFAVKVPLVPFHLWSAPVALAGSGSLLAALFGIKLGAYGLLRFVLPLVPEAAREAYWLLAGLGVVTLLYGAVGVLGRSNLRVGLVYLSISHVGLAVVGLSTFSAGGVTGAVAMLLGFALATGGAMVFLEFLRQRTGSTDVFALGGVAGPMPRLASGLLLGLLSAIALPGTAGFPGEWLVIMASLQHHTGVGMAALFGLAIGAAAMLHLYVRAFFGHGAAGMPPAVAQSADLLPRERVVLAVLVLLILGLGLFPSTVLDLLEPSATQWATQFRR